MQFFKITIVLSGLIAIGTLVSGSPVTSGVMSRDVSVSTSYGGLNISTEPAKWVGPSKGANGGINITLYGTADEVMDQLMSRDTEWAPFPAILRTLAQPEFPTQGVLNCCPTNDFEYTYTEFVGTAIARINGIGGNWSTLHPYYCNTLQTYEQSIVVLCSGINQIFGVPASQIVSYANNIANNCPWKPPGNVGLICGQQFDTQGFNLIITDSTTPFNKG